MGGSGEANKIIGFNKKILTKEINIDRINRGKKCKKTLNELTEIFEYDVLQNVTGKIVCRRVLS